MIGWGMHMFQAFLIALFVGLFLVSLVALLRGRITRGEGFLRLIVFAAASVAAIWPAITTIIAEFLGIGRGTDLLLYIMVLVMLMGFWMTYVRLRRLRRQITLLVRQDALENAGDLLRQARRERNADACCTPTSDTAVQDDGAA